MPVIYFLDGTNLSDSTSVYVDSDLTQLADDGIYSDGYVHRELSGGVLLPATSCPSCEEPTTPLGCVQYGLINVDETEPAKAKYRDCNNVLQFVNLAPNEAIEICALEGTLEMKGTMEWVLRGECTLPPTPPL